MAQRNLVLLGIGHTNAHIVKMWETAPIKDCQLTCISKFPFATYSGMLPGTLGLQYEDTEMRIDLTQLCRRSHAKLILANTNGLDLQTGEVHFDDHEPIVFDALSIGVGSMPAGWDTHKDAESFVPIKPMQTFLKRFEDSLQRIDRAKVGKTIDNIAETANSKPSSATRKIAIVGGGVASVEVALCLHQQFEKRNLGHKFTIVIFTSSDHVGEGMKPRSVARIERTLESRRIHIIPGSRVTEVGKDFITTEDGSRHDAEMVIWATGAVAPPVLGKLGLESDDRGFVATTATLQSLSDPRVFAVGDSGTILDSPSPKAGVYAVRQCPILWHNLQAFFNDSSMKAFTPQPDFLKLVNTGDGKALLQHGFLNVHARWCWHLKTWIDKRFTTQFRNGPCPLDRS